MSAEATDRSGGRHVFLPYSLDYVPEFLQERAKCELFENEDNKINCPKLLRSMLKDEPDLHWQDEDPFLLTFLRARKFDVTRAFNLVKTFYTVIGKHDELYYNIDLADIRRAIQDNSVGFLPYRDSDGCVIMLLRISHWRPQINSMGDMMSCLTYMFFHANLNPATQIAGFKFIADLSGLGLRHLPHVSPSYLWLMAEALQNCFPARFKAVHIVNENHIFSYIWVILKPLLSKKIRERFHFHGKNPRKLHKHFSPSILPTEYGGVLPHYDNTEWGNMAEENFGDYRHVLSFGYRKYKLKAQEKYSSRN